ncbi:MAG: hypothetical protein MJ137_08370 [Clostridia bacterium]|nr:hypothetical protein [Clostridia bacterium]
MLSGISDAGDNCIEYYYTDTTLAAFDAYCEKLKNNGYTLKVSNENPGVKAAGFSSSKANVYAYFVPSESSVRIIASAVGSTNFQPYPTAESVPEFKKITDSKITQMALNYDLGNFGNCYIITLADGSFVVMDGGGWNAEYGDDTRLFNLLKHLNKREDGKIVIAAYILSHAHWDHYRNFFNFVKNHSSQLKIEACYTNIASDNAVYNSNNPDLGFPGCFATMSNAVGGIIPVKLHTGMKFYVRNAEFEVMYTQEDIFPDRINYFNETSTVLRMTLEGTTVMWNGDAKNWASKGIVKRYGSYVKSDICTVAHHGYDGMTQAYYTTVAPVLLLWPTSQKNVATLRTGSTYAVDKYLWDTIGKDNIIIAEPTQTITLPYVKGTAPVTEPY